MYIMYKIRGIMLLQATVRLGLCETVHVSGAGRGQLWSQPESAY